MSSIFDKQTDDFRMHCDKCEKDFTEMVPAVMLGEKKMYRRDSQITFIPNMCQIDLCLPCEETTTVAEARKIAEARTAEVMKNERGKQVVSPGTNKKSHHLLR